MRSEIDQTKIAEAFMALCELHEKQISPVTRKMYVESLKEFSMEQITLAISRSIREHKWFPKPVELIELIRGTEPQSGEVAELQASRIIEQVRKVGSWGSPVWEDPITQRLMNSRFSYHSVCKMLESEMTWFVKEFKEAYRANVDIQQIEAPAVLKKIVARIGKGIE
ncbi:unnamed protein product [marine sediment metagenome]|uniref:Uncharacterized protein n=1 Tax=marine sediment metagenome TaxID=412755 RepID=X0VM59_9ZZZZ